MVESTDDGKYNIKKESFVLAEVKVIDLTEETSNPDSNFYGDLMVSGEPLESQILRLIESKGAQGASSNEIASYFGVSHLVMRSFIRSAKDMGYIIFESTVSQKTNQHIFIMKKFLNPEDTLKAKSEFSNLNHLSINLQRLELMMRIFQKHKVVTKHEIRPLMRVEIDGAALAQIDHKTLKKLLFSLCNEKKLIRLVLKGSNTDDGRQLEMYHVPDCDKDVLKKKVSLMTEHIKSVDMSTDYSTEGPTQAYISCYTPFPNGIPDDFTFYGDLTSVGGYHGPKTTFIQRFHLILSVLMYRWPVLAVLPSHLMELKAWWEYVLTSPTPTIQSDGSYEIIDLLNYFPICYLNYINKGFVHKDFLSVMEHDTYSKYCIGQLPKNMIAKLSRNIGLIINSMGKTIEFLDYLDLVELRNRFDFTKKSVHGFKFSLRKTGMLLNTTSALIHNQGFKGYNIRRINNSRKIMVFDLRKTSGFIEFWSSAKEICLSNAHSEHMSFSRNITETAKSLREVLTENGVPCDQPENFYHGHGTEQRLNQIYSELGPAGFNIKLMFNKKSNWCHRIVSSELKSKLLFRPDIAVSNVNRDRETPNKIEPRTDSDSDDYQFFSKPRSRNKKIKKISIKKPHASSRAKKVPSVSNKIVLPYPRKRKRQNSKQSSGLQAAKRVRKKYRDDFDKKVTSIKTAERVKFSVEEDDVIIVWSVCLKVFGKLYNIHEARDLLHDCCPQKAADKTAESTKKRRFLLLERPDVHSRIADLQVKAMAFKKMILGENSGPKDLFSHRNDWVLDHFVVRTILPASFTEFMNGNKVFVPGAEKENHLIVFLSEGYRNKRIQNFKDCNVFTIWNNSIVSDKDKHIYSFMIMSVSSQDSEHNEISYKILKSHDETDLSRVSDYMKSHQCIRKKKRQVDDKGAVLESQMLTLSLEVSQSLYSPFPDDVITDVETVTPKNLVEFHYSDLAAKHIHSLSQYFYKGACRVIISGAINPFVEHKKSEEVFQDIDSEESLFSDVHTKKNTFVSGFFSVDEAKASGFQLSEKHILGRQNIKVHTSSEEDRVEGYEELLGLKETSWPLPLKIFFDPVESKGTFTWKSVDFDTGVLGGSTVNCNFSSTPTSLNSYQLSLASAKMCTEESEILKLFVEYCQQFALLGLLAPGEDLLRQVFVTRETGILLTLLKLNVLKNHSITKNQVDQIIDICVNLDIILKVGFVDELLVGRQFGGDWNISPQRGILVEPLNSKAIDPNHGANEKVEELESDFTKYFPVSRKPWRMMNNDMNCLLLHKLVKSIVMFIYCYPGVSKELIDRRYHVHLSPLNSNEILECLLVANVIKKCYDVPPPATLFSSTFPAVMMTKAITSCSTFIVTEDGLSNLAAFLL